MQNSDTINLYRHRDFNEKINATVTFFRLHFRPLLMVQLRVSGLFALLMVVSSIYLGNRYASSGDWLGAESLESGQLLWNVITNVFNLLFTLSLGIVCFAYLKVYHSQAGQMDFPAVSRLAWPALASAFVLTLLYSLGVALGFVLLIIPGIYLAIRWSMTLPALIFEKSDPISVFGRSHQLIKGQWFPVFGYLLVISILSYLIRLVLELPAGILFGVDAMFQLTDEGFDPAVFGGWKYVVVVLATVVGAYLGNVFLYLGMAFQYFSLVEESDAEGLLQEIESLENQDKKDEGAY